jgi:hypothetical protein
MKHSKSLKGRVRGRGWKSGVGRNLKGAVKSLSILKAVQASLLLLFADRIHPLLQMCSSNFGVPSLLSFFFDLEHAPPVLLVRSTILLSLLGLFHLLFKLRGTSSPCIDLGLHLIALPLEICKSFLESLGELLLSKEVLLNGANASFLVLMDLGDSKVFAARTVALGWCLRNWHSGCICNWGHLTADASRKGRQWNGRWW